LYLKYEINFFQGKIFLPSRGSNPGPNVLQNVEIQNVELQMSKIQNIEIKNVEFQNFELQNVKNYKTLNLTERQNTKCLTVMGEVTSKAWNPYCSGQKKPDS
jgi:hypothetical protein